MDFLPPPSFFFLAALCGMQDLSCRTKLMSSAVEPWSLTLNFQGSPYPIFFLSKGNVKPNYTEIPLVTDHMVTIKANVNTQC